MTKCANCGGTGRIVRHFNWESEKVKCTMCNGTGIDPKKQCKTCGGTGTIWSPERGIPVSCRECKGNGIKW